MMPIVSTTTAYMLSIAFGTLAVIGIGAVVFLPQLRPIALCKEFVRTDWKYLGIAWLVTDAVNKIAHRFHADWTFTREIYMVEGSVVTGFQTIASTPLTVFFTSAYLVGFPAIVLFTYFKLKIHDELEARRYALAYVVLVLLSLPFFVLMPVKIPGLYPPADVDLLVFDLSPIIKTGMLATDTMVKAFPSLHTGLTVLAALYARKTSTGYSAVTFVLTGIVVFSTFYLGIHWFTDAAFAVMLVGIAYWVSRWVDPDRVLPIPMFSRLRPGSVTSNQNLESTTDD